MSTEVRLVEDSAELGEIVGQWRRAGLKIALVPTMGNLHAGHYALVDRAAELADRVVASIFVNPTQFGPGEDLERYPRTLSADRAGLAEHHCDLLFVPSVATIYPGGTEHATTLQPPAWLIDSLCGSVRPGHFAGVATVVATLFHLVRPQLAVFGEKDFQQLRVIQRLVQDLAFRVRIVPLPTVREPSGLAMSSRNGNLSPQQLEQAAEIYRVLCRMAAGLGRGEPVQNMRDQGLASLREAGLRPEYLEIVSAETLQSPKPAEDRVLLVAARLGSTRLIDNLRIPADQ